MTTIVISGGRKITISRANGDSSAPWFRKARKSVAESEGVYIYGEAAVDGTARVGKVDAEPLEGLDGNASAIIEVVDTAARGDGVCMIYGGGA